MTQSRQLYVNLAVGDPKASMAFFAKLGFEFNPNFTDDNAACMVISDNTFVMLLKKEFFGTFTKREVCNTSKATEGLHAVSCGSRAEVDEMVRKAVEAGGQHVLEPQDHGVMYSWSFYDLDGHHWEPMWMDASIARKL